MSNRRSSDHGGSSRRDFLKKGVLATAAMVTGTELVAGAAPVAQPQQTFSLGHVLGANDRLVVGFIGVGGQGFNAHLGSVKRNADSLNATGAAVCDLFSKRREQARAELGLESSAAYEDYRALLDRNDLDAVFIGTVDHWHARIAIDALNAGKHVYCEKPMTRYLSEGFQVYDAVKQTGKKFQIGSQYTTEGKWHKAAELIRAGKIGKLVSAQDSYARNTPDGEWNYYALESELEPGKTIDWKKWLGPVSDRPFNPQHYHRWRKYYPYCAGIPGDLLAHRIHPMLIATGNPEFPRRVACLSTKKITNETVGAEDRDVADNIQLLAEFPSGLIMAITGATVNEQGLGQVIRGNEATLYFGGNSVELRPERPYADLVDQEMHENLNPGPDIPAHIANFFDAIRNDTVSNGNIEVAIRAQTIISLAEMSDRLGEMLFFDEQTRQITTGSGRKIEPITYGTLNPS
jgi:predicted dehydrogenase